jgi:hypothetical protein
MDCLEVIYEGDTTSSHTIFVSSEGSRTIKIPTYEECYENELAAQKRREEEKEKFLFNLREEISSLKWHAHTVEDAQLMEHLSCIFTKIADYIENH